MGITVTATAGGSTANGIRMRVRALRNIAGIQNGAVATQSGAAAHDVSLTTTVNGSRCYGSFIDASSTAFTGDTGMTVVDNVSDATNVIQHGTGHGVTTVTPGAVTLGASAPADAGSCAFVEILPGGPLAEDVTGAVSSTAGISTSVTVAPPPGALLVAMVTSNGGAAVTTMTVSGGGLAWTEVAAGNAAGQKYAGVWLAFVPFVYPWHHPIQARQLPLRGGSTASRDGILTAGAPQAGPPVYPLGHPVTVRLLPARCGSSSHRTGTYAGTGPPVPALHRAARSRLPVPVLTGRTRTTLLAPVAAPPPVFTVGTLTAATTPTTTLAATDTATATLTAATAAASTLTAGTQTTGGPS